MKYTPKRFGHVTPLDAAAMTQEHVDGLPYGAIKLDREGTILVFNRWESLLARRDQQKTLGKNFFRDVAPCADVAEFRGRLDLMITGGITTELFDYIFDFPWGRRAVRIRFVVNGEDERWVFVMDVS